MHESQLLINQRNEKLESLCRALQDRSKKDQDESLKSEKIKEENPQDCEENRQSDETI